jgi:hypothetical protein
LQHRTRNRLALLHYVWTGEHLTRF